MKVRKFAVTLLFAMLLALILLLAVFLVIGTAPGKAHSNLQFARVHTEPVAQERTSADPFCGMEFVSGDDLATVWSLGVTVVLQTFRHAGDPAEWLAQLDLAQSHGLQVVALLWPEGWEWDGAAWQIDEQARRFVQTVAAHPATLAVYALHEPYWRGCSTCGLTTAQQQALYQDVKAIADVPLYSEIGEIAFWANQGEDTTLADGVCDYCGATLYPFFADGTYHRDEFISHLDDDIAAIRELAPYSRLVWGMQVFAQSDSPEPRRMPTAEEIADIGAIVAERDVDGIFWYVWWFGSLYDDFLSNHPELFPAVSNTPFCRGPEVVLVATPEATSTYPGQAATYTLSLTANDTRPVTLTLQGEPSETAGTFDTNPVVPPGTSRLRITSTNLVAAGIYEMNVTGNSGVATDTVDLVLVVASESPSFTLSIRPTTRIVKAGQVVTYTGLVSGLDGFSQPVSLTVAWLPLGVEETWSGNPVMPGDFSILTLSTAAILPLDRDYTLLATGSAGMDLCVETFELIIEAPFKMYLPAISR